MTEPMQPDIKQRNTEEFTTRVAQERLKAHIQAMRRNQEHQPQLDLTHSAIEMYRRDIGIEPIWDIEVRIVCPSDMPEAEASIWWNEQTWYARLCMRCDAPEELVYYLVVHELFELAQWRTGNIFRNLLYYSPQDEHSQFLLEEHLRARNQEIEVQTRKFMGDVKRPYHLNGPFEYSNPHLPALLTKQATPSAGEPSSTPPPLSFGVKEQKKGIPKRAHLVQVWDLAKPHEDASVIALYDTPTHEMPVVRVGTK